MCFGNERDYMVLLRTYSCNTTDNLGILKCKVLEHYSSLCAAHKVTGQLFGSKLGFGGQILNPLKRRHSRWNWAKN